MMAEACLGLVTNNHISSRDSLLGGVYTDPADSPTDSLAHPSCVGCHSDMSQA
jgi:hypothetical protein